MMGYVHLNDISELPSPALSPGELLVKLEHDRASWSSIRDYPSTITCRRMIRLASFAATNPGRWWTILLHHQCPALTHAELAIQLGIDRSSVSRHLQPLDLSDPSDYPMNEEDMPLYMITELKEIQ